MDKNSKIKELEKKFLSRIKSQDRFYRKGSNHDLFPIGLITTEVNQGRKGEEAKMNQFFKKFVINQIIVHYKTEDGICKQCKWEDLKSLKYDTKTGRVTIFTSEENGILMEPPMSEYTIEYIHNLSPELSDIAFPQEEMILNKPKGYSGKEAIHDISLDHVIPINLCLYKDITRRLFPKLHDLNIAIQNITGFEEIKNQKEFEIFLKDNMNDEIKSKCWEVFEEFINPESKSLEYLFKLQLMSRGSNSSRNNDNI